VKSSEVNALALPGGIVWITRPLFDLVQAAPDELAFILGHEMGHIMRRHAMDRLMTHSVLSTAIRAGALGGLGRSQAGRMVMQLLEQGYSQDQELDADRLGVRLSASAGYDPQAAIRLLLRLKARSGEPELLGTFFASHPPFDTRVQNLDRVVRQPRG
jgi:predicted Zn-dependent protease